MSNGYAPAHKSQNDSRIVIDRSLARDFDPQGRVMASFSPGKDRRPHAAYFQRKPSQQIVSKGEH